MGMIINKNNQQVKKVYKNKNILQIPCITEASVQQQSVMLHIVSPTSAAYMRQ